MSGPFNPNLGQLTEFLFNRGKMFIKLRELEGRRGSWGSFGWLLLPII